VNVEFVSELEMFSRGIIASFIFFDISSESKPKENKVKKILNLIKFRQ
jgi:hypothetical protein